MSKPSSSKKSSSSTAPSRATLDKKAAELGIPLDPSISDKEVAEAIAATEKAMQEEEEREKQALGEAKKMAEKAKAITKEKVEASTKDGKPVLNIGEDVFEKFALTLAKAISDGNKEAMRPDKNEKGQFTQEAMDPDDTMSEPKMFFAHRTFHVVGAKTVNGTPVQMPYGKQFVRFELLYGVHRRSGTQESVSYVSVFMTRSKKMYEYLRTHHEFNRRFFEEPGRAMMLPEQARRAQIFGKHMATLMTLSADRVFARAHKEELAVSSGTQLSDVRSALADKMTEDELKRASDWQARLNAESAKQQMLMESAGG